MSNTREAYRALGATLRQRREAQERPSRAKVVGRALGRLISAVSYGLTVVGLMWAIDNAFGLNPDNYRTWFIACAITYFAVAK